MQSPIVAEMAGEDWFVWSMGFLLGLVIELGTNTSTYWPCLGQPADVAESIYFTYFYVRAYFEDGYQTTMITYIAVYIARGVEAVMYGPCWQIADVTDPNAPKNQPNRSINVTERVSQQDQEIIRESNKLAQQFEQEMYLIDMMFTVMTLLEILIDAVTFKDLWSEGNHFDSGTIAGKGLVNTGFTLYYLILDNFLGDPEVNDEM